MLRFSLASQSTRTLLLNPFSHCSTRVSRRSLVLPMAAALSLVATLPARSQNSGTSLARVLSGSGAPLSIKAKDLTPAWRQFVIGSPENLALQAMVAGAGVPPSVFYTKGFTVSMGGETYLVTYRAQPKLGPQTGIRPGRSADEDPTAPPLLAPDATLTLSLLNLRTAGNLNDVRPFDPNTDIEKPQDRAAQATAASMSNLKQLGLALMQYTQDYDDMLPQMNSATSERQIRGPAPVPSRVTVQQRLWPYARAVEIFRHPTTKQIYRPNSFLSRKARDSFKSPAMVVTFYEASPDADGLRAVLYLDGHVKRERETDWPRIKRASHIPP
jgi:hypothetical protein